MSGRKAFRPMIDGLPVSIPISQALKNMGALSARPDSKDSLAADARASLGQHVVDSLVGATSSGQHMPHIPSDQMPAAEQFRLKVTEIDCYDRNPRRSANERAEDIRESLKSSGFHGTFTVTRKPGGDRYFLSAGGNTTLKLLQQLYETSGEERFLWVHCRYQPYASELQVLCQHLGENLNRGEMAFFDIARGMVEALEIIERERRGQGVAHPELSLREASEHLTKQGLKADKSSVSLWRFSIKMLTRLGPAVAALNYNAVRGVLQPRINGLVHLGSKFGIDEASFRELVLAPVLQRFGTPPYATGTSADEFAQMLCDEVESTLAAQTNEPPESIRQMLRVLRLNAAASLAELRQPSPNIVTSLAGDRSSLTEEATNLADEQPAAPVPNRAQAPLALGPGLVRGRTQAHAAGHLISLPPPSQAAHDQHPQTPRPQDRRSSIGPLFESPLEKADPLEAIHTAVERLALAADLAEILRWQDEMPLGFYLEQPSPAARDQTRGLGNEEIVHRRAIRSHVWWTLTTLAGQWLPGIVDYIDRDSLFYQTYSADQHSSPLEGTDIAPSPPTSDQVSFLRIQPGRMRAVMRQLMETECLIAERLEQLPERWARLKTLLESQEG